MIVRLIVTTPLTPLRSLPASASNSPVAWTNQTVLSSREMFTAIFYQRSAGRQQPIPTVPFPLRFYGLASVSMTWSNDAVESLPQTMAPMFAELRTRRQQPIPMVPFSYQPPIVTSISPGTYAIEIRDKDFRLKDRLENAVTALQWEWNRRGGCGRCTLQIKDSYLRVVVAPDDDIRVYLKNSTSGATLWYRGYVESATPAINGGDSGEIRIECAGYFKWTDRVVVNDAGGLKTYSNQEISLTVTDIVDNFLVANSPITRGTIDASTFAPDSLVFKVSCQDALQTCYDLLGSVEYGVDANLQFFWRNQSESLTEKFFLGGAVVKYSDRIDFKNIVNKIYFEGGESAGVVFTNNATAQDSIDRYGLHEEIVSNGSIISNAVFNRYVSGIFTQKAKPQRQMAVSLKNVTKRFEANQPMGAIAVVDPDVSQSRYLYGKTASGGSNKKYGLISTGGDGLLYGGVRKEQVERVVYTMSPEDGRVDVELQFGSSVATSRASATMKQIEQIQSTLRQRSVS